jgi:hypothetical protein
MRRLLSGKFAEATRSLISSSRRRLIMFRRSPILVACLAGAMVASTSAVAGEIKGPPPTANYTGQPLDINSRSICAFSGLNDSPLGDPNFGDPGGITQSFGSFFGSSGYPVSQLDPRNDYLSPGFACNPTRGDDLHGG